VQVFKGHSASHVETSEVVVYSSAVKPDNPEFRRARELKIPLIPRAEALAEMMRLKRGVAIGGSHGKTTTTSMVASIFLTGELNPTIVVGGRLDLIKSTALLGTGDWLVAEADESDGSFLRLSPEVAIVTNIDNDHLDHYGSIENVEKAFYDFAQRVPFFGLAVVCGDDPRVRKTFLNFGKRIIYYGFGMENDLVLKGENGIYSVLRDGASLGEFKLKLPGRHNALNALAAIASGLEAGLSFETCSRGLERFQGVDRRFQFLGTKNDIDVYDDYGHHPTEVRAVLQAVREKFANRRVVTVFQPHRYSRTQLCWEQFKTCFDLADVVLMLDIYPAGEPAIENINSKRLVEEIRTQIRDTKAQAAGRSIVVSEHISVPVGHRLEEVLKFLKPGDLLLTLGAGDIFKLGREFLELEISKK
jgi:UDP-N-acetylmuramate--alanine ligase